MVYYEIATMIIDSHTHVDLVGRNNALTTVDLLRSMDKAGIDISLVIANDIPSQAWQGISATDIIAQAAGSERIKVIGYISVARNISSQLELLQQQINAKKVVAIKLYPGYEDFLPQDERLWAVYDFCLKQHVPAVFHTGYLMEGAAGKLRQAHPHNVSEIAGRYPDLSVVMAHCGSPWIKEAAHAIAKHANLYVDLSGYFTEYAPISSEERNDFIEDMAGFASVAGDFKKCLFGTDWPLYDQTEYLVAVQALPMTKEEKELVLWRNAYRLFRL